VSATQVQYQLCLLLLVVVVFISVKGSWNYSEMHISLCQAIKLTNDEAKN